MLIGPCARAYHIPMNQAFENFFARWRTACGGTLPPAPWHEAIASFMWTTEPGADDDSCTWQPMPKMRQTDIAAAAPDLPRLHESIHRWFNSWWFCACEGPVAGYMLVLEPVAPGVELDSFLTKARGYAAVHGGVLDRVPIGIDSASSLQVVVDNHDGSVGIEDWERGTITNLAPSLEALLDRMYRDGPAP